MHLLATFLLAVTTTQPKRLEEGRIYSGSQFKGTVHHGKGDKAAGAQAVGHVASTLKKQTEMNVTLSVLSPFPLVHDYIP